MYQFLVGIYKERKTQIEKERKIGDIKEGRKAVRRNGDKDDIQGNRALIGISI